MRLTKREGTVSLRELDALWAESCREAVAGPPVAKLRLADAIYSVHRGGDGSLIAVETQLDGGGSVAFRGDIAVGDPARGRAVIFGGLDPGTTLDEIAADANAAVKLDVGDGGYVAVIPYVQGASVVVRRRRGALVQDSRVDIA